MSKFISFYCSNAVLPPTWPSSGGRTNIKENFTAHTHKYIYIYIYISGVESVGWLDFHFTVGTSCERAVRLAEKNVAARHRVLRSPISLQNEHPIEVSCWNVTILKTAVKREIIFLMFNYSSYGKIFQIRNLHLTDTYTASWFQLHVHPQLGLHCIDTNLN
jgi:hypothetical protein